MTDMSKEAMKLELEHAKRDERHASHAETRYWCRMYRDIAEKAVEALALVNEVDQEQPAHQCNWPSCQSEKYQQALAEQIKRELVGEQPAQQEPGRNHYEDGDVFERIAAMKTQPAQQEPVANNKFTRAWLWLDELPGTMMQGPEGLFGPIPGSTSTWVTTSERERDRQISFGNPMLEVYTSPPAQRTWVHATEWRGLTDEDIASLDLSAVTVKDAISDVRAVEAKLKEKNA